MTLIKKQKGKIPIKNGHSIVDFRKYLYDGKISKSINTENFIGKKVLVKCFAYIKNDSELKHRFRIILSKTPTGWLEQRECSFELIAQVDKWTFLHNSFDIEITKDFKYMRMTIDTKGGNESSTYWITCPFFTFVEKE